MASITCTGCAKSFSFDPASTPSSEVYQFSAAPKPAKPVNYFPTCPHCKTRHVVTLTRKT